MLLSNQALLIWTNRIKTYYVNKGYLFTNIYDPFLVNVEDLTKGSHAKVNVKCDCDSCKNPYIGNIEYRDYISTLKKYEKYYCKTCISRLFASEKRIKTFINKNNSFAQWGIDNLGEDFLEKYWDYEKNTISPFEITYCSDKKVFIKCQKKDYHDSYYIACSSFIEGKRCSYCSGKKVNVRDSLGYIYPNSFNYWSDKNNKTPYDYTYGSGKQGYWKCNNNKHEDFLRSIHSSVIRDFRCPYCQYSKGEKRIEEILFQKDFIKITQEDYNKLNIKDKLNYLYFIPQKEFNELVGLKNGNLSYDFYLPNYNLLIEFQGQFHDNDNGNGTKYMELKFARQQEHDKRKREYAKQNDIDLLEIWYWDFDNIKEILINKLNI